MYPTSLENSRQAASLASHTQYQYRYAVRIRPDVVYAAPLPDPRDRGEIKPDDPVVWARHTPGRNPIGDEVAVMTRAAVPTYYDLVHRRWAECSFKAMAARVCPLTEGGGWCDEDHSS